MYAVKLFSDDPLDLQHKLLDLVLECPTKCGLELALYETDILDKEVEEKIKEIPNQNKILHSNLRVIGLQELTDKNKVAMDTVQREGKIANALGVFKYVVHASLKHLWYLDKPEEAAEKWVDAVGYIHKAGLVPFLEKTYEPIEWHQEFYKIWHGPQLGFCLDVGHSRVWHRTKLSRWLDLTKTLKSTNVPVHFHIHGNAGHADDHIDLRTAYEQGILEVSEDWAEQGFIPWLKDAYYAHPEALFTLENQAQHAHKAYNFARFVTYAE